jgi:hypothetical protein
VQDELLSRLEAVEAGQGVTADLWWVPMQRPCGTRLYCCAPASLRCANLFVLAHFIHKWRHWLIFHSAA